MDSIFSVKNVNLYYGDKHVLKDVNLEIYEKQVTAFIGPSGCGKSTLLRCLDRMNDLIDDCKVEGEILYKGKDVKNYDAMDLRSSVGMVFQTPNPFPLSTLVLLMKMVGNILKIRIFHNLLIFCSMSLNNK